MARPGYAVVKLLQDPMKRTQQVLNELERDGVVERYAIGEAMAATFYVEPLLTFDLDVFVILPQNAAHLVSLAPLRDVARAWLGRGRRVCPDQGCAGPISACVQRFVGRGFERGTTAV